MDNPGKKDKESGAQWRKRRMKDKSLEEKKAKNDKKVFGAFFSDGKNFIAEHFVVRITNAIYADMIEF